MAKQLALWISTLIVVLTWPILATPVAKPVAKAAVKRTTAAYRIPAAADIRATGRTPRAPKKWDLRINLAGGYAQVDSSDAKEQSVRDGSRFNQTAYFGLGAELALYKYFGSEIEGYYGGLGSSTEVVSADALGTIKTERRRLRQYGVMGDVQGRLPFYLGRVKLIPRAGLGYGVLATEAVTDGVGSATTTAKDAYATAGLEIRATRNLSLNGDYAISLGDRFDRIRAGVAYRVADPVSLGTQYLRRQLRGAQDKTETSNQVLGTIQFGF